MVRRSKTNKIRWLIDHENAIWLITSLSSLTKEKNEPRNYLLSSYPWQTNPNLSTRQVVIGDARPIHALHSGKEAWKMSCHEQKRARGRRKGGLSRVNPPSRGSYESQTRAQSWIKLWRFINFLISALFTTTLFVWGGSEWEGVNAR